ncbi:hypothetical protein K474DRAFT_1002370 [Panus rudis PR-1116 ss-1]|nr:hypothetical protein K474DRAFT_1002370 [Panus rudis PR-1116 ss-1]
MLACSVKHFAAGGKLLSQLIVSCSATVILCIRCMVVADSHGYFSGLRIPTSLTPWPAQRPCYTPSKYPSLNRLTATMAESEQFTCRTAALLYVQACITP